MNKEFKPTMCIYHGNCADGFGAAWCVWSKYPDIMFVPGVYGQPAPDCRGHDVVLVDFSYDESTMRQIAAQANSVLVLDHHKTAEENLSKLFKEGVIDGEFDMNRSGAMMAWNYFHPSEEAPLLIQVIQDRDLWKFAMPFTRNVQAALFSYPYEFELWDVLVRELDSNEGLFKMQTEGGAIERKHFKDIEELLAVGLRSMNIGGFLVPVCNLPYTMASDACNKMCGMDFKFLDGKPKFAASYYDKPGLRVFSLRSVGEFDVSAIAKMYGGGGHKNAAGFTVECGWEGDKTGPV